MPSRRIRVVLHARARELAGVGESWVEVPGSSPCAAIKRELALRHPPLAGILGSCVLATDDEFLQDDALVGDAVVLRLIPPVSGG